MKSEVSPEPSPEKCEDCEGTGKGRVTGSWEGRPITEACPNCKGTGTMGGTELIAAERERQISDEGWTPEHDDQHTEGQLAKAAACYAVQAAGGAVTKYDWPWEGKWWKPGDPVRGLVKAGALIAAEIDRLRRAEKNDG